MKRRRLIIITAFVCCLVLSVCADRADGGGKKASKAREVPSSDMEVVEALLKQSRLLENVHFRVPRSLWVRYFRSVTGPQQPSAAPVDVIPEKGLYRLAVEAGGTVALEAEVHLRVFKPNAAANRAVLTDDVAWTDVRVARNGEKPAPIDLVRSEGWMRYSPATAGMHVIHARAKLSGRHGEGLPLPVGRTVRTLVAFDSDRVLHVTDPSAPQSVTGAEGRGTRGVLALKQTARLDVTYRPPVVLTEREARYQLSGPVAWNIDAGGQDVAAKLNVAILAGRTDRLDLDLPPGATRPTVTGPDVRETRVAAAGVTVHLRGRITGKTALTVKFALPDAGKDAAALAGLGVRNGRWAGGTLVVTNSAGSREIMPAAASGLAELALADVPRDAAAILTGRTALAYAISAGEWSAAVEVVDLGEFALRETIADLAHYEIVYRDDGSVICKADYEVRNRNRQFLAVSLPPGSKVLLARVNEKSRPLTPAAQGDAYLLPLVRSKASVIGLVSFPVEIVFVYRAAGLNTKGDAAIDLPRIDVPIAYAWCEAYLPETMAVTRWAGPLKRVDRYSSETATASMAYGRSELAEGYKRADRFTPHTPAPIQPPTTRPATTRPAVPPGKGTLRGVPAPEGPKPGRKARSADGGGGGGIGGGGLIGGGEDRIRMPRRIGLQGMTGRGNDSGGEDRGLQTPRGGNSVTPSGVAGGNSITPLSITGGGALSLGRNYYRSGKEQYEQGNLEGAERALENTVRLAPDSNEAVNAKRLLSNIKLAQGKLALKTRSEKASGSQVFGDITASNRLLVERQKQIIERGFQSIRAGDRKEALKQFQAAEALNPQLLAQGEQKREQDALLRKSRELLGKAQAEQQSKAERYLEQIAALRQKGEFDKAAEIARKGLADTDGDGPVDAGVLQRQLDQLTVLQAGKEARKNRFARDPSDKGPAFKPSARPKASYTLQFNSVPCAEVIRRFARQANKPIIGDLDIKGYLTFFGAKSYTYAEAIDTLNILLEHRSYALREEGRYLRLYKVAELTGSSRTLRGHDTPAADAVTVVLPLAKGIDVGEATKAIIDKVSSSGAITPVTNGIVITDRPNNIKRIRGFLDMLDSVAMVERPTATIKVQHGSARDMAKMIEQLFGKNVVTTTYDERTNLLMMVGSSEHLAMARKMLAQLDQASAAASASVPVMIVPLEGVSARELAKTLGRLFDKKTLTVTPDEQANALVLSGTSDQLTKARQLISQFDTTANVPRRTVTVDVKAALARALAEGRARLAAKDLRGAEIAFEEALALDKDNREARNLRDQARRTAELDERSNIIDRTRARRRIQKQQSLVDMRRSEIPWWEELRYPDDWKGLKPGDRTRAAQGPRTKPDPRTHVPPGALQKKLPKLDFANVPLGKVIEFLREVSGVSFYVNWRALQVASVDKDTEVNVHLVDVTLEEALKVILDDVSGAAVGTPTQVGFEDDNGVLRITTREALSHRTYTRVYDIRDIIAPTPTINMPGRMGLQGMSGRRDGRQTNRRDHFIAEDEAAKTQEELLAETVDLIKDTVSRDTWEQDASIRPMGGQLVVTQTREGHAALLDLLSQLRQSSGNREEEEVRFEPDRARPGSKSGPKPKTTPRSETHARLESTLPKLDFADVPLELVVQFMREVSGMKITVDWKALDVASVDKTTEVNVHLVKPSFGRALQLILDDISGAAVGTPTQIVYGVSDKTILITTAEAMSHQFSERKYDIRDLMSDPKWGRGNDFAENITDTLKDTIDRDSWDNARIRVRNGTLVVSQTLPNHDAIAKLLADLRTPAKVDRSARRSRRPEPGGDEASRETKHRMNQVLPKLDFDAVPFELVIQFLREVSGISIYVNWRALQVAYGDKATEVDLHETDVTFGQALQAILADVSGKNIGTPAEIDFTIDKGVIHITTVEAMSHRTYTRVYSLSDLVKHLPQTAVDDIETESNFNNAPGGANRVPTRDEFIAETIDLIRESISPDSWEQDAAIRPLGEQLAVTNTQRAHEAVEALLAKLRTVRRRQIQEGQSISLQRAGGKGKQHAADRDAEKLTKDREFQDFLERNYAWQRRMPQGQGQGQDQPQQPGQIDVGGISTKLGFNEGQKVQVGSININASAAAAGSLGIRFRRGNNNVIYTTIDEAQFRTLMEMDVKNRSRSIGGQLSVAANPNRQDTIVGTDALLANHWFANVTYSADRGNTIDVFDNPVNLRHEDYILIDNNGYLTAVRAGQMVHWRDQAKAIEFVETPQDIDVPRAGRLVRFEKTLVSPADRLVIKATYTREGK